MMRPIPDDPSSALAQICALEQNERERRWVSVSHFIRIALSASEMPDGVSFEFSRTGETMRRVIDFLRVECGCCPSLSYTLRPGSTDTRIALDIRSNEGDAATLKTLYAEFLRT
jgi:hypothetical protein